MLLRFERVTAWQSNLAVSGTLPDRRGRGDVDKMVSISPS